MAEESGKEFLEFLGYDDAADPDYAAKSSPSKQKSNKGMDSSSTSRTYSVSTRRTNDSSTTITSSQGGSSRRIYDSSRTHSSSLMGDSTKSLGSSRRLHASNSFKNLGSSRSTSMRDSSSRKQGSSRRGTKDGSQRYKREGSGSPRQPRQRSQSPSGKVHRSNRSPKRSASANRVPTSSRSLTSSGSSGNPSPGRLSRGGQSVSSRSMARAEMRGESSRSVTIMEHQSVTIMEDLGQSMSSVGMDLGGSFQKDSSKETQTTLREEDELVEDLEILNKMMQSDGRLRDADSKSSLNISDLSLNDSNHHKQDKAMEKERRPSLMDRFKGMSASYPGHVSSRRNPSRAADHRSYTTRQMSSSSMMASTRAKRTRGKQGKRRSSLFNHMQDLFQGSLAAENDEQSQGGAASFVDLTVDEEKPLEVGKLDRSRSSGGSGNANRRRAIVFSLILLIACLAATAIVIVLVLHVTKGDKSPAAFVESDSAQGTNPNPILPPENSTSMPQKVTETPTSSPLPAKESPSLESHAATETPIPPPMQGPESDTPEGKLDISQIPTTSRADALKFLILDQQTSNADEFKTQHSPSTRALQWISEVDPAKLGIPGIDNGHDKVASLRAILQRYALAVFYFSQEASETTSDAITEVSRQARLNMNLKWTSGQPVCEWPGIECNGDSMVTAINLSSSLLQGTLPQELLCGAAFPAMTSLDLSHNRLLHGLPTIHHTPSHSAVGATPSIIPLQELRLTDNILKGWMNTLTILDELKHLDLSANEIAGKFPDSISSLSKLTTLALGNNYMHGNLSHIEALTNLETLHLNENQFTGTIPSQWSALANLKALNLGHNEYITGSLPSSPWAQLTNLRSLDVRETGVSGTIPPTLSQMTRLEGLHLHGTSLAGPMPEEICQLRSPQGSLDELTSDCDEMGTVTCNCCTECFWG